MKITELENGKLYRNEDDRLGTDSGPFTGEQIKKLFTEGGEGWDINDGEDYRLIGPLVRNRCLMCGELIPVSSATPGEDGTSGERGMVCPTCASAQ